MAHVHREDVLYFHRFTLAQRIMHVVLFSTFLALACTGFSLKFWHLPWAKPLIWFFGGPRIAGIVHRCSGIILVLNFAVHILYIIGTSIKKIRILANQEKGKGKANMVKKIVLLIYNLPGFPRLKDLLDIIDWAKYTFLISKKPPMFDKFCWIEKIDYLALFWGNFVFAVTGPMFWFSGFFTKIGLPGWAINIAYIFHGNEAILGIAVVFIWHFFNVHFAPEKLPMGSVWLTGYMSEADMVHEHINDYLEIMSNKERFAREVLVLPKSEEY